MSIFKGMKKGIVYDGEIAGFASSKWEQATYLPR